jgi:hypothetical protein
MSNDKRVIVTEGSSDMFEFDNLNEQGIDVEIEDIYIPDSSSDEEIIDINLDPGSNDDPVMVEDLDDSETLWDNGPTAGMVKEWKQQYGEVYVTSVSYDHHIIWRVLNRMEYKQIVKKMEQLVESGKLTSAEANMWNEEVVAKTCILYPTIENGDVSGLMAGVPSLIAQEVLEASGFVALEVRQL